MLSTSGGEFNVRVISLLMRSMIVVLTPVAIAAPGFTRACLRRVIGVPSLSDGSANAQPASRNAPSGGG